MPHFAGFASTDSRLLVHLMRAAGPRAKCYLGAGGTVITDDTGGEVVTVTDCAETGETTVRRGEPLTAGCGVTLYRDTRKQARVEADTFGQHSVFTCSSLDGGVCFASDPRLLRTITTGSLDVAALKGYLCFSHVPHPLTLWDGIHSVVPSAPAWNSWQGEPGTVDVNGLRALLKSSVERRLTTGDIGVYLSGGLDSSLIAALLVEAGVRPRLFTLDFGPPFNAEIPAARAVAEHLNLPLTVVPCLPRHVLRTVTATAKALPQPFGDSVTVPLYRLGQEARDYVSEVWNGEGGDQLFGGWANKPMIAALTHGGDTSEEAELREYQETYHRFGGITDRLLTPALREAAAHVDNSEWIRPALDRRAHGSLLHRLRAANLRLKGAQNIAPRMVALAECHGLRVRAPFFDRDLTEATFRLPPDSLLAGACEKHLLKQVAEAYLPAHIVWREKRGMGVPSTEWCLRQSPLGWAIRHRLSARRLKARGWFQPTLVRRLLHGDDPTAEGAFRRRRVGEKLWLLYMLDVWCDAHANARLSLKNTHRLTVTEAP